MASSFGWLDFSDRDRQRAMDVVDPFREEDTRDELGLGVIRDAFADRLFPGTSTIQTRVRYFVLLPWLFGMMRPKDTSEERFAKRSRQLQEKLRQSLVAGEESLGVIGFVAGATVQRLPSSVYWQGLRRWGILRFRGSENDYRRELARVELLGDRALTDDGDPVDDGTAGLWDPELPLAPDEWLESTRFELSPAEAQYLTHRIEMAAPGSLLAHLIHLGVETTETDFAWEHMAPEELPSPLDEEVLLARNFSESMHGASLLYNLMLAEEKRADALTELYRAKLAEWWQVRTLRADELDAWDRTRFWSLLASWHARVRAPAYAFVEHWLQGTGKALRPEDVMGDRDLRNLVRNRERSLKGPRARLGNPRSLDLWRGASGTAQLDYRWRDPVRRMVTDLIQGMQQEE